jgi:predicted MFS family arabinose efflux permease
LLGGLSQLRIPGERGSGSMREAVPLRWWRPPDVLPLLGGILALAAAMGIGRFAYTPLLPAMQEAAGLDPTQAGLLAAANYAGYLVGALLVAVAVPASARIRILMVSAIAVVATTALMAVTTNLAAWSVIRFVAGLASAGVLVIATGIVLDNLRRQGRATRSGWLFSGVGLGIVVSGVVVRVTSEMLGWRGDWLLLALLASAAIYPCWRWLPRAVQVHANVLSAASTPEPAPTPLRAHAAPIAYGLLFTAYFLEGIGYIVTGTFLVAVVDSTPGLRGIGVDVWIVVGLAVIPSAVLWAALAGRAGYARALAGAYMLQAIGIALPIAGGAGAAFASAVLFGGTFAGITALTLTLGGHLETSRSARLIGMLTAVFGLGQMIGPVLGGVIADRAQNFTPSLAAAAVCVLAGGVLMASLQPFDPLRQGSRTTSVENRSTRPLLAGRRR